MAPGVQMLCRNEDVMRMVPDTAPEIDDELRRANSGEAPRRFGTAKDSAATAEYCDIGGPTVGDQWPPLREAM
jgi:hypothetical protein